MAEQRKGNGAGGGSATATSRSEQTENAGSSRQESGSGQGLLDQVKSSAGEALTNAKSNTVSKIEEQKSVISGGLSTVAENLRQMRGNFDTEDSDPVTRFTANYSEAAAEKIESAARYFDTHDVGAMYNDLEGVARRNPALVVGGAFALGFLAARFFKSSGESSARGNSGGNGGGNGGNGRRSSGRETKASTSGRGTGGRAGQSTTA